MFRLRHLITQVNLGNLKNSRNQIKKLNYSSSIEEPTNKEKFETLIRIDHTETQEQKRIKLSKSCIKRLQELSNTDKYLRIAIDSGGCSGFEYKFSLDKLTEDDKVIEEGGCKVLVDSESVDFIKGATIDYYEELIKSGFRIIDNPNSEEGCSCGASFSVKF